MRILSFLLLLSLAACSKTSQITTEKEKSTDLKPETCNFGLNVFNKMKRPASEVPYAKVKPPKGQNIVASNATILLVFDGDVVSNTVWNTNGTINCAPSNLNPAEIEKIIERVSEDFSPFNVNITTDDAVYNNTPAQKRMKVIVTESWEWFGVAGGIAYPNSFLWGNNTPCFVFSTLLHYNEKYIAEAISHEVGHTLGLHHQRGYTTSCSLLSEYNSGKGFGITGWAPIMGNSYYNNVTTWHKGPTTSCGDIQDDVNIISGVLGIKPQQQTSMQHGIQHFSGKKEGLISNSGGEQFYSILLKNGGTVEVNPNCIGNEIGANLHLKVNIYHPNGSLLNEVYNTNKLSASVNLPKGKYYLGVTTIANDYQDTYGMLGRYVVTVP